MHDQTDPVGTTRSTPSTDALLTASRLLVAISAQSIASVDETLTIPQFRTMVILSARGPVNLTTLAGQLDLAPSTTGRMAERLVAADLIDSAAPSRRPGANSSSKLTARGLDVVAAVTGHRRGRIAEVVRKMPPRERQGLVRALTAFTTAGGEQRNCGSRWIPCLTTTFDTLQGTKWKTRGEPAVIVTT